MASLTTGFLLYCLTILSTAVSVDDCPGYAASNVVTTDTGITADLNLAGNACNVFGYDLGALKLQVEYQTSTSIFLFLCAFYADA